MTEGLKQLRKQLPYGSVKEISGRVGLCSTTVSRVLSGKIMSARSSEIIQVAIQVLGEHKEKARQIEDELNQLFKG